MTHTNVDVVPVPVHVMNHPEPKRFLCRSSFRTVVLTATVPYTQLAGFDPLRERVKISGLANSIVVTSSTGQASDPANLVAVPANPNGRLIPGGATIQAMEWTIEGTQEIWFSGGTYPTMIGCEIIRKVPED